MNGLNGLEWLVVLAIAVVVVFASFALMLFNRYKRCPSNRILVIFGRVPLFFYLIHFPLIHAAAVVLALARHGRADWLFAYLGPNPPLPPPDAGLSLAGVYLVWVAVVLVLYWPCRWYADVKHRHPGGVLSYL